MKGQAHHGLLAACCRCAEDGRKEVALINPVPQRHRVWLRNRFQRNVLLAALVIRVTQIFKALAQSLGVSLQSSAWDAG